MIIPPSESFVDCILGVYPPCPYIPPRSPGPLVAQGVEEFIGCGPMGLEYAEDVGFIFEPLPRRDLPKLKPLPLAPPLLLLTAFTTFLNMFPMLYRPPPMPAALSPAALTFVVPAVSVCPSALASASSCSFLLDASIVRSNSV